MAALRAFGKLDSQTGFRGSKGGIEEFFIFYVQF